MARFKFKSNREDELQQLVLSWLNVAGYTVLNRTTVMTDRTSGGMAVRMPIGAYPFTHKGKVKWGQHPLAGFPDIIGILKNRPGVLFAIELKSTTGTFRPGQEAWIARLNRAGCVAFVARDLNTVVTRLREADVAPQCS